MNSQLLPKLLSINLNVDNINDPGYCHEYFRIIEKIGKIFHFSVDRGGTGPLPQPDGSKNAVILFKRAILYDQYTIDQFIFPLIKFRLDHEFNLFIKNKNNNNDNKTFIDEMDKNTNYQNILHIVKMCAIMQNNVMKMIKKIDQFIEKYKNGTFRGGSDHNWAMSSVEQQIIKLGQVKHNLNQLNFDNINNLFKDWFDKNSKIWNDIMTNDKIKNNMDQMFVDIKQVSHIVLNKIIPSHWPYLV